jgi:hypothetical protein
MVIGYSVTLEYSDYSDSHSNFEFEGKIKTIAVTNVQVTDFFQKQVSFNE